MRLEVLGIVALASVSGLFLACDTSNLPIEYSIGDGEPVLGAKVSMHVTPEFSRRDTQRLHAALQTRDFRAVMESVACGETVPDFKFTVSLWRQAPMHVRHVEIREEPWLDGGRKSECLVGAMKFFVIRTIQRIERARGDGPGPVGDPEGPVAGVEHGIKGVRCDCLARASGLPSVEYEHWPIH